MSAQLDPRFEWHETASLDGAVCWLKGQCLHTDVVPVESAGAVVAHLCTVCDAQLPAEWRRP